MKSWGKTRFDEIFERVDRKFFIDDSEQYKCVGVRWYGMGAFVRERLLGAEISRKQQWIIRSGDIVYNKLFAWKGAFAVADQSVDGCIVSDKFPTYRAKDGQVDDRWLRYYFRTPMVAQQAEALSKGAAAISKLTLNPPQFWDLTIPLPPVTEQRRIVARIESLAAQIHEVCTLRERAVVEAQSLFFSCCESLLREAETKFPCRPLEELVEKERGISYGIVQTGLHFEGGTPTVRAGDLRWFDCNTIDIKQVEPEIERAYQRTQLRGGELLLRIRGGVGELAVCPKELAGGNVSREIAVIPLTEDTNSRYAMFMLAAPTNQERVSGHVKGTSYVGINLRDVRTLNIPVPPLAQQHRIVAELDVLQAQVDALKKLQAETAAELDALLPSILDKAFKGDL